MHFFVPLFQKLKFFNAICEMKNGKMPGPDGISVEF